MENILILIGSPQFADKSVSTQAANYFVEEYKKGNAEANFDVVNVSELPEIRFTSTILAGEPTEADMAILANRTELMEKYLKADKIVIATPMWDFSLPGTVKEALDTFCVAGKTFRYLEAPDADGNIVEALTPAKKILVIQAMGGAHKGTENDLGFKQIQSILGFIGNKDIQYVAVENVAIPDVDSLAIAKTELQALATQF
jgi:FMN-dependent NADH-azoreductase